MLNVRLKEFQKELSRIKLYPSVKEETVPWIVSEPLYLSREQFKELELIGKELREFLTKCWKMSSNEWNKAILGLPRTVSRGVLLQKKILSARYEKAGLTISDDLVELKNLSIRVSPYYLFWKRKSTLAGILVTLRQSIKVHGAQDAIFTIAVL